MLTFYRPGARGRRLPAAAGPIMQGEDARLRLPVLLVGRDALKAAAQCRMGSGQLPIAVMVRCFRSVSVAPVQLSSMMQPDS